MPLLNGTWINFRRNEKGSVFASVNGKNVKGNDGSAKKRRDSANTSASNAKRLSGWKRSVNGCVSNERDWSARRLKFCVWNENTSGSNVKRLKRRGKN